VVLGIEQHHRGARLGAVGPGDEVGLAGDGAEASGAVGVLEDAAFVQVVGPGSAVTGIGSESAP
jgi:hypothetical protein